MAMCLHTIMEIAGQIGYNVQIDNDKFCLMIGEHEIEYDLSYADLLESLLCLVSDNLDMAHTELESYRYGDDRSWLDDISLPDRQVLETIARDMDFDLDPDLTTEELAQSLESYCFG